MMNNVYAGAAQRGHLQSLYHQAFLQPGNKRKPHVFSPQDTGLSFIYPLPPARYTSYIGSLLVYDFYTSFTYLSFL